MLRGEGGSSSIVSSSLTSGSLDGSFLRSLCEASRSLVRREWPHGRPEATGWQRLLVYRWWKESKMESRKWQPCQLLLFHMNSGVQKRKLQQAAVSVPSSVVSVWLTSSLKIFSTLSSSRHTSQRNRKESSEKFRTQEKRMCYFYLPRAQCERQIHFAQQLSSNCLDNCHCLTLVQRCPKPYFAVKDGLPVLSDEYLASSVATVGASPAPPTLDASLSKKQRKEVQSS